MNIGDPKGGVFTDNVAVAVAVQPLADVPVTILLPATAGKGTPSVTPPFQL